MNFLSPDNANIAEATQVMLGQLSTAVCVLTLEGEFTYINSAAEHILQSSRQRALGSELSKIARLPKGLSDRMLRSGESMQPFSQRESIWIIQEQEVTLDLVVTPIHPYGPDNLERQLILELQVVDRILKISRDEKTYHSHQAHRALIRGLAHEVKNPLGAIRGATQLLERCIHQEFHEYTEVIIDEVDRLSKLVDQMLGPRTPLHVTECNIHEVIERVLRLVAVEAKSQDQQNPIALVRKYDLSLPEMTADQDRLIQAILNIVTNARQALINHQTNKESKTPLPEQQKITILTKVERQITLHHRLHRLAIRVTVQDNGPGIPEKLMQSLFYPLVSGRADGSGIGLSVAQHIVQQHGGTIECESKPGCTQFHLFVPVGFLPIEKNSIAPL